MNICEELALLPFDHTELKKLNKDKALSALSSAKIRK